jgi:hypothetical protein
MNPSFNVLELISNLRQSLCFLSSSESWTLDSDALDVQS